MRVAAETYMPWFQVIEKDGGELEYGGVLWDFIQDLAVQMNFTFSMVMYSITTIRLQINFVIEYLL